MRGRGWWLALALAVACGKGGTSRVETAEPAPAPAPPTEPPLALHEWGVVGYDVRDEQAPASVVAGHGGVRDVTVGPLGVPPFGVAPPVAIEKPVLYAHVRGAPIELSLEVAFPGGRILERLPPGELSADARTLRWSGLVAGGPSCASSRRIALGDPTCDTPDGYCESVEDPVYDTGDASCIRAPGGETRNHLLYRGELPRTALPLVISFDDRGGGVAIVERPEAEPVRVMTALVAIRNAGASAMPGKILRVTRDSGGAVSMVSIDPPDPGETVRLLAPSEETTPAVAREAFLALVADRGLRRSEVEAFDRAWSHLVVGTMPPEEITALRAGPAPAGLHPSPDALYYVLSEEAAAAAIPLRVEGTAATIRRAIVVRVDLDRSSRASFHRPLGMRHRPPPDPAVRIERLAITGDYPEENVRAAFFRRARAIDACLLPGGLTAPAHVGVTFDVAPDHGLVRAVLTDGSSAPATMQACLLDRIRRTPFAAATERTTVSMTLRLAPNVP